MGKTKLENFELQRKEFDVSHIITETIELYLPEATRKKIDLTFDSEEQVQVCGDPEMIKLAIRNLVNNAVKFCREGDSIKLKTYAKNGLATILIQDTGVGMTAEKLNEILGEKNLKASSGTNMEKGVGLGLILISEFVKANNGKIMASSEPDIGTTFKIELPQSCP